MSNLLVILGAWLVLSASTVPEPPRLQSASPGPAVDVTKVGPAVGTRVPDFSAVDHLGREQSLRSLLGPNGAMLVFFRSADW